MGSFFDREIREPRRRPVPRVGVEMLPVERRAELTETYRRWLSAGIVPGWYAAELLAQLELGNVQGGA